MEDSGGDVLVLPQPMAMSTDRPIFQPQGAPQPQVGDVAKELVCERQLFEMQIIFFISQLPENSKDDFDREVDDASHRARYPESDKSSANMAMRALSHDSRRFSNGYGLQDDSFVDVAGKLKRNNLTLGETSVGRPGGTGARRCNAISPVTSCQRETSRQAQNRRAVYLVSSHT